MEYLIGIVSAFAVAALGKFVGLDRDRAYYPMVLMITATYYVLFAVMGATTRTLVAEIVFACGFFVLGIAGFKRTGWFVAAGLVAHGIFDLVRPAFIHNPGVPHWWPGFCMAIDFALGAILAGLLVRRRTAALR